MRGYINGFQISNTTMYSSYYTRHKNKVNVLYYNYSMVSFMAIEFDCTPR
ncbi:prepilin-type processing-associated H-X9-DG domain-containing protein [Saccharicrinis carchari]|uniref:Prepilin-type processing-associated H-X9-DG domain-containing protein n=1 Tax=Saccharicrinis carchari TaxID=1168039 RepID=A0A521AF98_SACCC|nr:prepilin-type processing-associated H-X9-DG domain-containing protein [Saccharicrinis carchari]